MSTNGDQRFEALIVRAAAARAGVLAERYEFERGLHC